MTERCPVCLHRADRGRDRDYGDRKQVRCPRCGPFEISRSALAMLGSRVDQDPRTRARLSHAIRSNTSETNWLFISSGNVTAFATRINAAWGSAVQNHRGNERLIENLQSGTWAPGTGLEAIETESWPDGRAGFVLEALRSIDLGTAVNSLPDDIQWWIADAAAA